MYGIVYNVLFNCCLIILGHTGISREFRVVRDNRVNEFRVVRDNRLNRNAGRELKPASLQYATPGNGKVSSGISGKG